MTNPTWKINDHWPGWFHSRVQFMSSMRIIKIVKPLMLRTFKIITMKKTLLISTGIILFSAVGFTQEGTSADQKKTDKQEKKEQ